MPLSVDLVTARMKLYTEGTLDKETQRAIVDELMEARLEIHQHNHDFDEWRTKRGASILETVAAMASALHKGWTWEQYVFDRDRRLANAS